MSHRYSAAHLRRSILHFLFGKLASSLAGFAALFVVVHGLAIQEFAQYSTLVGLVDLLAAISSLGLTHAILRFIPELYTHHYRLAIRRFVGTAILARTMSLLLLLVVMAFATPYLAPWIGLAGAAETAFSAFLVVVLLRSTTQFLSQVLESTLSQGISQLAFALSAATRLSGVYFLYVSGPMMLVNVIWVEAIAEGVGLLLLLGGVIYVAWQRSDTEPPADDASWMKVNLGRIVRFGLNGYLQHMLILPSGGNPNRLLGGHFLAPTAMAGFGFAQSLADYIKRYLPAQMLLGVIRPVIVARYVVSGDFAAAARLSNLNFRVNALLVGYVIAFLPVAGEDLIKLVTGNKYGWESAAILYVLMAVLLLETLRQQLDVLVQAVERYEVMIGANILMSSSVIITVLILPAIGAMAFPLVSALALVGADFLIIRRLGRLGFHYSIDWRELLRIAQVILIATISGYVMLLVTQDWRVGGATCLIAYTVALARICRQDIRQLITTIKSTRPATPRTGSA
jgi:O-antigen/teichoic acid export membrane protein